MQRLSNGDGNQSYRIDPLSRCQWSHRQAFTSGPYHSGRFHRRLFNVGLRFGLSNAETVSFPHYALDLYATQSAGLMPPPFLAWKLLI